MKDLFPARAPEISSLIDRPIIKNGGCQAVPVSSCPGGMGTVMQTIAREFERLARRWCCLMALAAGGATAVLGTYRKRRCAHCPTCLPDGACGPQCRLPPARMIRSCRLRLIRAVGRLQSRPLAHVVRSLMLSIMPALPQPRAHRSFAHLLLVIAQPHRQWSWLVPHRAARCRMR
jgi:hypothetical protein